MQATLERLRQRRNERGDEGGFTLIELLIVIIILAILAAIVVFAVQNLSGTSAKAACKADFKTVETGAEAYKAQLINYPGGTVPTGYTVSAAAAANGYIVPTVAAHDTFNGVNFLMQTTDTDASSNAVGPWLKDWPINKGHYEIVVSYPTSAAGLTTPGQIDVYKADGTGTVVPAPAHTSADCDSVT